MIWRQRFADEGCKGENTDSVPVYDTCDDIRRQITAYLKKPGVTQAQFARDLLAQYHSEKGPKGISASQIQSFRGKKGPDAGNTSSVFYSAYVFFEKMRIKQGKPKSQKRKEMEEVWGPDGFDTENANKGSVLIFLSSRLFFFIPCPLVLLTQFVFFCCHYTWLTSRLKGSSVEKARLSQWTNVAKCTSTHHLDSHKERNFGDLLCLLTLC